MPKKTSNLYYQAVLVVIFLLLLVTRFLGNNYDAGLHLHPDERWLIMVSDKLHLFNQLNPDFFAYGSLPLYLLKAATQGLEVLGLAQLDNYNGLLVVGRFLTSVTDILVAATVFLITKEVSKRRLTPYLAMLLYALMFFPIQNSNFFIVDNFLNLFLSLVVLLSIRYLKQPSWLRFSAIVVVVSAMLATKITSLIVVPVIFGLLFVKLLTFKTKESQTNKLSRFFVALNLEAWLGFASFFVFMPYGILRHKQFIQEVIKQVEMGKDPYVFPYTLQYVDTAAYLYPLKNIFLWGAGPIIGGLGLLGAAILIKRVLTQLKKLPFKKGLTQPTVLIITVYLVYFLVLGQSSVKFMRYMLPLYPFIALAAALSLEWFLSQAKSSWVVKKTLVVALLFLAGVWLGAFLKIYLQPHTRVQASKWILSHVPAGSVLAVEHWDDRLPLFQAARYRYVELPLYEVPDDKHKWYLINQRLAQADYLVIASKRLSAPLTKLADCQRYKRCYPNTAKYYQNLFLGKRGFIKVAEFDFQPTLDFGLFKITLDDNKADESFSVYDHPHVIIFKKIPGNSHKTYLNKDANL